MYVVSLIAAKGGLAPALVESLRNAWGGGDAQWLAPDEAAEFTLAEVPGNRWDVWADLQKESGRFWILVWAAHARAWCRARCAARGARRRRSSMR